MARDKNITGRGDKPSKHAAASRPAARSDGAHTRSLRSWKSTLRLAVFAAIAAFAVGGLAFVLVNEGRFTLPEALRSGSPAPAPAFVGSQACAGCHQTETALWKESQHKHAMQHATAASGSAISVMPVSTISAFNLAFSKRTTNSSSRPTAPTASL